MNAAAITFYRQHHRVVEALVASKCFSKTRSTEVPLAFLQRSAPLRELVQRTEAFNLFEALGVVEAEIRHSRFLAWLLDPQGSHGAGCTYLRAFVRHVCAEDGDGETAERLKLDETEVSCESDRIDILLVNRPGRFVCAVENKVRIDQGAGQLERYRRETEAKYREWDCKFVFLTLKDEEPDDPAYLPLSYTEVLNKVLAGATAETADEDTAVLALLLSHYAEFIRADGKLTGTANILEILHLARTELKHSHFLAWLLNPGETHHFRDAFGRFLLRLLEQKGLVLPMAAKAIDLSDAVVRREREKIDILLISERHRLVVAVENKVRAPESDKQLEDYVRFLRSHYAEDRLVRVFLDLKGRSASHADYVSLSYRDLLPFFDEQLAQIGRTPSSTEAVGMLCRQYAALLTDHLWIKRKTTWKLPVALQGCCEQLATKEGSATAALLGEVTTWQNQLAQNLEGFLYDVADRCFGKCFRFTWDVWFSFIPPVFDAIPVLAKGGADPAFPGRMLIYQFFVIPFGDSGTVRRPGIFLDVKLIKARPSHEKIKAQLHEAALGNPIFNRVKRSPKIPKFDILHNYEVCAFEEAVVCDEAELRRRISIRMERFTRSIHPEIVAFFKQQLADVEPKSTDGTIQ